MAIFDKLAGLSDKLSQGARRMLGPDEDALAEASADAADEAGPTRGPAVEHADLPAAFRALGIDQSASPRAARAAYRALARPLIVVQTSGMPDAGPAAERLARLEDALALVEEALMPLPKR